MTVGYKVTPKLSPKLNEPITLVNTREFEPATGEFLGSKLSELGGVVQGQINLDGEVAPELPPIVVGSRLQEKGKVVNANNKFQGAIE